MITFRVTNHSNRARYFYLVNLSPDGTSHVIFPNQGFEDNAKVPAQSAPQLIRDSAVQVDGPRDTYIWFVTETPTNVWALEGKGFEKGESSVTRGGRLDNALAQLLGQAGALTRGIPATAQEAERVRRAADRDSRPPPLDENKTRPKVPSGKEGAEK